MTRAGQVRIAVSVQIGEDMFHDHARTFNLPATSDKIYQTVLQIAEAMKPFCALSNEELAELRDRAVAARED